MKYIQDELDYSFKVDMPIFEDDGKFHSQVTTIVPLSNTETVQSGSQCTSMVSLDVSSAE
jgi:hypothetical protein